MTVALHSHQKPPEWAVTDSCCVTPHSPPPSLSLRPSHPSSTMYREHRVLVGTLYVSHTHTQAPNNYIMMQKVVLLYFEIFIGCDSKEKREKEREKRKKKKGEKEERKRKGNQFLYSSMSLTKPPWRQRTQCISIPTIGRRYPPLIFYPHTHYQTHANGESNRVTGGANPRAWRGGADLPPAQLMRSFYIILHARSFSRSVDRLLSGSRRTISGCIARLHSPSDSPSDSPSTIRSTIHTLLHLESHCGLGEWY